MSVYLEMAERLRQEIADAQAHLDRLKVALNGLEPLITIDAKPQSPLGLGFEPRSSRRNARTLMAEVLDVVPHTRTDDLQGSPPSNGAAASQPAQDAEPAPRRRGPGRPKSRPGQDDAPAEAKPKRPRKGPSAQAPGDTGDAAAPSGRRPRSARSTVVPSTGGSYWLKVMGKRKYTLSGIVDKAIGDLGVPPDTHALLSNRLSAWLYPALKAGRIEEAGSQGRHKLYRVVG